MNKNLIIVLTLCVMSCVGLENSCASCGAESFGGNWIITQFNMDGKVFNCWKLQNASISNETNSDGIWWRNASGHLIHISGWYNRIQVTGDNFNSAAIALGISLDKCTEGIYKP